MFGRRKQRNSGAGMQAGNCICPQCGYSEAHQQGISCRTKLCPNCGATLVREGMNESTHQGQTEQKPLTNTSVQNEQRKEIPFPKVNSDVCIGCGNCMDICPKNAIEMENDKAKIIEANCKKCRKCVKVCSVNAIQ